MAADSAAVRCAVSLHRHNGSRLLATAPSVIGADPFGPSGCRAALTAIEASPFRSRARGRQHRESDRQLRCAFRALGAFSPRGAKYRGASEAGGHLIEPRLSGRDCARHALHGQARHRSMGGALMLLALERHSQPGLAAGFRCESRPGWPRLAPSGFESVESSPGRPRSTDDLYPVDR